MENNIFIADKNKGAEKTLTLASARDALEADDDEESGDEEEDLQRLWGESCGQIVFLSMSFIFNLQRLRGESCGRFSMCSNTSLLCIASAEKKMRYMRDLR